MIKEIRLKNFKAFCDTHRVPVRALTLIFGTNSAGKSSIIQSLLLLKQSVDGSKTLALRGDYVDLGQFRTLIFGNLSNINLGIGVTFRNPEVELEGVGPRIFVPPDRAGWHVDFEFQHFIGNETTLTNFTFAPMSSPSNLAIFGYDGHSYMKLRLSGANFQHEQFRSAYERALAQPSHFG